MRIITRATLAVYWPRNPQAKSGLLHWHRLAKATRWRAFKTRGSSRVVEQYFER